MVNATMAMVGIFVIRFNDYKEKSPRLTHHGPACLTPIGGVVKEEEESNKEVEMVGEPIAEGGRID